MSSAEWPSIWRLIQTSDPYWISIALSSVWSKLNNVVMKSAACHHCSFEAMQVQMKWTRDATGLFLFIGLWSTTQNHGFRICPFMILGTPMVHKQEWITQSHSRFILFGQLTIPMNCGHVRTRFFYTVSKKIMESNMFSKYYWLNLTRSGGEK